MNHYTVYLLSIVQQLYLNNNPPFPKTVVFGPGSWYRTLKTLGIYCLLYAHGMGHGGNLNNFKMGAHYYKNQPHTVRRCSQPCLPVSREGRATGDWDQPPMVNNVINHTYIMNPLPFLVKCQCSGSFWVGEHIHKLEGACLDRESMYAWPLIFGVCANSG